MMQSGKILLYRVYLIKQYFLTQALKPVLVRLWNFILTCLNVRLKPATCSSMPICLSVEVASVCNFRCPFCPVGNDTRRLDKKFMDFSEYKAIIDKTYPYTIAVSLFLFGEPLLNKDVIKMVAYAASRGIAPTLHTNMSIMNVALAEGLIQAGLFKLYISADGYTQSAYEKYRIGGSIEEVFKNIGIFIETRRKLKRKNPLIVWKYLINKYNESETEIASDYAKKLKIDIFLKEYFHIPDKKEERVKWTPLIQRHTLYDKDTLNEKRRPHDFCNDLWSKLIVDCEGDTYFCCLAAEKKENRYGNLFNNNLEDLWNSRQMLSARGLVRNGVMEGKDSYCATCRFLPKNFEKIVHKKR